MREMVRRNFNPEQIINKLKSTIGYGLIAHLAIVSLILRLEYR
jgi:hypothetical protein